MALALCGPFIWSNTQILLAFLSHGSVDQDSDQFRYEIQALLCHLLD
jgi:hypothetical protein